MAPTSVPLWRSTTAQVVLLEKRLLMMVLLSSTELWGVHPARGPLLGHWPGDRGRERPKGPKGAGEVGGYAV